MRHLALVPALLLCAAATGQELKEASADSSPRARYGALLEEFERANKEWMGAYRQAARSGDQEAVQKIFGDRPNAEFAKRFLEAAMKEKGDAAAPFLVWIVQNGYGAEDEQRQALELILANHIEHEDMKGVAQQMRYGASTFGKENARKLLDTLVDKSPHEDVVSAALYSRATMDQRRGDMTEEEIALACADLERLLEMDLDDHTRQRAVGALFEYRALMVGMTAPDIEGEDLDGVPFKLSDYRGKVVVLDFWGDW